MARFIDAEKIDFSPLEDDFDRARAKVIIMGQPTADVVEVVRCKDCIWFVPEHIKRSDGTTRPYTDEEKKLPCGVTSDIGINVGSYCLRKGYWEQNGIPVWFGENDFCSYGERK